MKAISARTPMRPMGKTLRNRPISTTTEQQENIAPTTATATTGKNGDPVQVFCRVRPLQSDADLSCIRVKNSTTVVLTPTEHMVNYKLGAQRETQYIFKNVFQPLATQRDLYSAVAQPLVENLIRGRNSLLLTYGVTGSGKTYTMTGDARHRGIMPRCLDALFETITDYQTKKYIFKPDRLNGFEILSETDALLERQAEMNKRFVAGSGNAAYSGRNALKNKETADSGRNAMKHKDSDTEIASKASCDMPPILGIDEDNMFAVFVTYIEIYNNSVYDLLEDGGISKQPQSKIIREDVQHNMFVHGVTEIEVKSVNEAIDVFLMGQKRKRMGHTILNAESSRSHSVFNIRLVQAPTDYQGENIVQDKRTITVSQLSLVDLAGSERSSRTKNTGVRLREAGNINNSLMTLRTCLEYLRENQQAPAHVLPKKIPYRDSKITHLFKNYFDGEGQVSMIVCVNPRAEDYDENAQVMKFAEMTQEVQIARATPIKPDFGLTPGRRKANKLFKIACNNLNDLGHTEAKDLEVDVGVVYTLGPGFPELKIDSPEADTAIQELMQYLVQRIERRKVLSSDLDNRCDNFRTHLMHLEKDNLSLRTELASIKAVYAKERERAHILENKIRLYENNIDTLNNKLSNRERQIDELSRKLNENKNLLNLKELEKEKQKKKFNCKLAVEVDKKNRELETKLREQRNKMQEKMHINNVKMRLVSNILQSDDVPILHRSHSSENLQQLQIQQQQQQQQLQLQEQRDITQQTNSGVQRLDVYATPRVPRGMAAANNRHRRSRSAGEKWIEHRAPKPVPLGTILQPYLKNRKSVTKLAEMKDLTGHKATKYCLVSQDADTDGDVETKLYKGDVIPTCGGGAQVVFDDVECLKQKSPVAATSPTTRKRPSASNIGSTIMSGNGNNVGFGGVVGSGVTSIFSGGGDSVAISAQDLKSRCNVGIEGHSSKRTKL